MIDKRCFDNGHITEEAYALLNSGELEDNTRYLLSEHLASCNKCSVCFAEYLTADMLVDLPYDFNEEIIKKVSKGINVVPMPRKDRFTVIQYMKLATAAVMAVSLYSVGFFNSFFNITNQLNVSHTEQILETGNKNIVQKFNKGFNEFSKKIKLNGVDLYEKK